MTDEKKTECVRLHLPESLFTELARLLPEIERLVKESA